MRAAVVKGGRGSGLGFVGCPPLGLGGVGSWPAPLAPWPPHRYLSKLGGAGGCRIQRPSPPPPPGARRGRRGVRARTWVARDSGDPSPGHGSTAWGYGVSLCPTRELRSLCGGGGGVRCGAACRLPRGRGHGPPGLQPACWRRRGCSGAVLGARDPNQGGGPRPRAEPAASAPPAGGGGGGGGGVTS